MVSAANSVGEGADSPPVSAAATMTIPVPNAGFENPTTVISNTIPPGADNTPLGDPDADGLQNLVEYALGLDPVVPNANPRRFLKLRLTLSP